MFFFVFSFDVDVLKITFFGVAAPGSVSGCVWLCRIFVSDFSLVVVAFVFVFCLFCLICFCFCFFFFDFFVLFCSGKGLNFFFLLFVCLKTLFCFVFVLFY